jgi:hypothetical protein
VGLSWTDDGDRVTYWPNDLILVPSSCGVSSPSDLLDQPPVRI